MLQKYCEDGKSQLIDTSRWENETHHFDPNHCAFNIKGSGITIDRTVLAGSPESKGDWNDTPIILSNLELCADKFDQIYSDFLSKPCSCCEPNEDGAICEPPLFDSYAIFNSTFNETGCQLTYKDWAYLSENNDLVWHVYSPKFTILMDKTNIEPTIPISIKKNGFGETATFWLEIREHNSERKVVQILEYYELSNGISHPRPLTYIYTLDDLSLPFGQYVIRVFTEDPTGKDSEHMGSQSQFFFSSNYKEIGE